jgi:hypothetical protein
MRASHFAIRRNRDARRCFVAVDYWAMRKRAMAANSETSDGDTKDDSHFAGTMLTPKMQP